jgi:hypothetical protein
MFADTLPSWCFPDYIGDFIETPEIERETYEEQRNEKEAESRLISYAVR